MKIIRVNPIVHNVFYVTLYFDLPSVLCNIRLPTICVSHRTCGRGLPVGPKKSHPLPESTLYRLSAHQTAHGLRRL